jgi:class 3 adenylate cyclase
MSGNNASDLIGRSPDRRKLIAVLYADMVGYSRLIGSDDAGTLERLRTLRRDLIDPTVEEHGGRIVQTGGDSLLIVFDSIDGAVHCAVEIQRGFRSMTEISRLIEPSASASESTSATLLQTGLICTGTR